MTPSTLANRVARWDGAQWSPLGDGMDDRVNALAVDGVGTLYAGGEFITADGGTVNHIARWDGNSWHALGDGTSGAVLALSVDADGNLYAGGSFAKAGDLTVGRVAKWDGVAWSAFDTGTTSIVHALALHGGDLYAGGQFYSTYDDQGNDLFPADSIARWDGAAWNAVGDANTFVDGDVYAIAVDGNGHLYIAGKVYPFNEWDGNIYVAKWDGAAWSLLGNGFVGDIPVFLRALTVDGNGSLYAGGIFLRSGGVTVNHVARWDGGAWRPLGSGTNGLLFALAFDPKEDALYAGGLFKTAGEKTSPYVAKYLTGDLDIVVPDDDTVATDTEPSDDTVTDADTENPDSAGTDDGEKDDEEISDTKDANADQDSVVADADLPLTDTNPDALLTTDDSYRTDTDIVRPQDDGCGCSLLF